MPLSKETKDRIAQQAHDWRKNRPIYTPAYVATGYISGAEAEAERAAGLVEKLVWLESWVSDRHGSDNPISKEIREALTKYNNPA